MSSSTERPPPTRPRGFALKLAEACLLPRVRKKRSQRGAWDNCHPQAGLETLVQLLTDPTRLEDSVRSVCAAERPIRP
ncbi:MAG: hypothetical protein QOH12_3922 [Solirubrobacteraceae bacterium]|nr:hypothetical protein [Solirubrobacteraceae bacterium]